MIVLHKFRFVCFFIEWLINIHELFDSKAMSVEEK